MSGVRSVGTLKVESKNANLPLRFHLGTIYLIDGNDVYEYLGTDNEIDLTESKKSLQLKKVIFVSTPGYSWWTPSCKPAIYLYPKLHPVSRINTNNKDMVFTAWDYFYIVVSKSAWRLSK